MSELLKFDQILNLIVKSATFTVNYETLILTIIPKIFTLLLPRPQNRKLFFEVPSRQSRDLVMKKIVNCGFDHHTKNIFPKKLFAAS